MPPTETSASALVPSAPRQPDTVPSSLTNRNASPLNCPAPPALNTWPVTLPAPGMVTTSGTLLVACVAGLTRYSVDVSAPLDDTQNGLVGEYDSPQALTRPASVVRAGLPAWSSVTRFVTDTGTAWLAGAAAHSRAATASAGTESGWFLIGISSVLAKAHAPRPAGRGGPDGYRHGSRPRVDGAAAANRSLDRA